MKNNNFLKKFNNKVTKFEESKTNKRIKDEKSKADREKDAQRLVAFETTNFGEYDETLRSLINAIKNLRTWQYSLIGLLSMDITSDVDDKYWNVPLFSHFIDYDDLESNESYRKLRETSFEALKIIHKIEDDENTPEYELYMIIMNKVYSEHFGSLDDEPYAEKVDDLDGIGFILHFAHSLVFANILPEANLDYYFQNWQIIELLNNVDLEDEDV